VTGMTGFLEKLLHSLPEVELVVCADLSQRFKKEIVNSPCFDSSAGSTKTTSVDMVVGNIIVSTAYNACWKNLSIYHASSSDRNPATG
jgi:hypothetical protein